MRGFVGCLFNATYGIFKLIIIIYIYIYKGWLTFLRLNATLNAIILHVKLVSALKVLAQRKTVLKIEVF